MTNTLNLKKRPVPPTNDRPQVTPHLSPALPKKTNPPTVLKNNINWSAQLQHVAYGKKIVVVLFLAFLTGLILLRFGGSLLLMALIIFASAIILFTRTQASKKSAIEIHSAGITIDGHVRYWREFHSFWIEYNPGGLQELSLQLRKLYLPRLTIPLSGQDPMKIRGALIPFIPEEEHELSVVDAFLKQR